MAFKPPKQDAFGAPPAGGHPFAADKGKGKDKGKKKKKKGKGSPPPFFKK